MHGWIGKLLRVDLTSGKIGTEPLNPAWARDFIGARGLGTRLMYEEVDPRVDPLSPENKLMFVTGPLTGTFAPTAGRYNVVTKSPLTGTIAASNSGGNWGPELKTAGYDAVIFEGKAPAPVYLWIEDEKVEIRDATHLWGQQVPETTEALYAQTRPDAKVACIGPAGEHLSLIAAVMNDMHRAAGRSGVGAVMGSKNLKAVVVRGTGAVSVADQAGFLDTVARALPVAKAARITSRYGTGANINPMNAIGGLPTANFQESHFATADKVSGETLTATLLLRPKACFACPIACGRVTKVTNPKYAGEGEGPEYETAFAFGPDCSVDDLEAVTKAGYICNEMGLDTISMGSTVACAMELFQRGIITLKDTEGLQLEFGNGEAMVEAVRLTGLGEAFGKKLALGSWRMASLYGHPELSMTSKKQEMAAYEPRAVQGMGLAYATSNRGGCHVRGFTVGAEVFGAGIKMDKNATEGKAAFLVGQQNRQASLDSTGCCNMAGGLGPDRYAALMTTATGVPYDGAAYFTAGERIWNLERLWNLKAGLTAADDTLPPRILNEPIPKGPSKGAFNRLGEMLPEYYSLRGWGPDGIPSQEKLAELALDALAPNAPALGA